MKFEGVDCILVMGRRGCGKSHLARMIQEFEKSRGERLWSRRVIFDPLDEYKIEKKKFPDRVAVHTFHQFTAALEHFKKTQSKSFELVVKIDPEASEELQELEFNEELKLCFYFEHIQIVVEEVQLFSNTHSLPKWLKNCLLIGRHKGLSLMFTSQRPGEVHKTILSQCHHVFCGQISEGNDLRYLSNFLGDETKKLPTFPRRRFLHYGPAGIAEFSSEDENFMNDKLSERQRKPI